MEGLEKQLENIWQQLSDAPRPEYFYVPMRLLEAYEDIKEFDRIFTPFGLTELFPALVSKR